jgi:hypothetical protein
LNRILIIDLEEGLKLMGENKNSSLPILKPLTDTFPEMKVADEYR